MAGISTPAYRVLARRFGAAVVYSEMVSSNGIVYNSGNTHAMLSFTEAERPIGIQLFGANPDIMHRATLQVAEYKPDIIDLNFGCPVKKVVTKNGGAAVLKDLGLTKALIEATVDAFNGPVTIKLRSGWDEETKNFLKAGEIAQNAGARAVTLHARTRSKGFSGKADWNDIALLKSSLSIPVIGNGDVISGAEARRMLDETGCDAVMIGRAAMGNPWIFREINTFLDHGALLPPPTIDEKIDVILEHARILLDTYEEKGAMLKMRGIQMRYTRGWPGASELRKKLTKISTLTELEDILNRYRSHTNTDIRHAAEPS